MQGGASHAQAEVLHGCGGVAGAAELLSSGCRVTAKIEYWNSKYYTSTKKTKPPSAQCHTGDSLAAGTPVPSDLLELGPASDVASAQGTVCMLARNARGE